MIFIKNKKLIFILIGILVIMFLMLFLITKKDNLIPDDQYITLYESVIDLIMDSSPELNSNAKYIAIDTDSFT